jgi:hypothetical protein
MNIKNSIFIRAIASCFLCSVFLALAVWSVSGSERSSGSSQKTSGAGQQPSGCQLPPNNAYDTTVHYVETFYPLWFTRFQAVDPNTLVGPERVSPLYHSVVMVNDDTIYCSAFLNLVDDLGFNQQPMILTIPATVTPDTCAPDTTVTYSVLILSPYGDVVPVSGDPCATPTPTQLIPHGAPPQPGGKFALVGPNYMGVPPIPPEIPPDHIVQIPWSYPTVIFRGDKYHSFDGAPYVNQINQANLFRSLLQLQTLDDYLHCPFGGIADVKPEFPDFAAPYKTTADEQIAENPIEFLKELKLAVHSPRTPPNACAQQLSEQFDNLFGNGNWKKNSPFGRGAQQAHADIVDNYVNGHQIGNNWTHFTNIGNWDWTDITISNAKDRSSITEFCQFCNDITSAGYYHAFRDRDGRALNGNNAQGYILRFSPPGGPHPQPETMRFWSLTAYTPQAIELIPNKINRYEVASYSGAHVNADGSLWIYMSQEPPGGVPIENWLPVGKGPFNVVLRDYGPPTPGSVVCDTYIPPDIERLP